MILSKCVACDSKKSKFTKDQEASELLNLSLKCNVDHLQKKKKEYKKIKETGDSRFYSRF